VEYRFTVPAGAYTVQLKFAEVYYRETGQRVFSIALNGQIVEDNFDAFAQAGYCVAIDRSYEVNMPAGELTIVLTGKVAEAGINAIEIVQRTPAN
jgi:hypothetical protein